MFREIFRFETRLQLKRHLFYSVCILFAFFGFMAVSTDWIIVGGAIGSVDRNAPFVIMQILLIMSILGIFVTTAFVSGTVQRDYELNAVGMFHTAPITKWQYLGGRFLGALVVALSPMVATALGMMLGSMMPWIDQEQLGAFRLMPYLYAFVFLVLPNVLIGAAIFFAVATLSRSMLAMWVGVVVFFTGFGIASVYVSDLENEFVAALLDPFGFSPFQVVTQYWTVFEKNTNLLPLTGAFVMNRLVWGAVAVAALALTFFRFRFQLPEGRTRRRVEEDEFAEGTPTGAVLGTEYAASSFSARTTGRQFLHETGRELVGMLKSIPFIVILIFAVLNLASAATVMDQLYGTSVFPVTSIISDLIRDGFLIFIFIVITVYSGDLVWKERTLGVAEVRDALPVPTWVGWASKLIALAAAVAVLLGAASLTGMGMQVFAGFFDIELGVYFTNVFANQFFDFLLIAVLGLALQVATNNKYFGYLGMVVFYVVLVVLPELDFEHNLYQYSGRPFTPYSDMNGFGHFVLPAVSFLAYWGGLAVVMMALVHLFWVRSTDPNRRGRFAVARQRLNRSVGGAMGAGGIAFAGMGAFIFYNTNVLNTYETSDDQTAMAVEYEKTYKEYEGLPHPRITDVYADVDIYPDTRAVDIRGRYMLVNKTDSAIGTLHVLLNRDIADFAIELPGTVSSADSTFGYYIHELDSPIRPGDSLLMPFEIHVRSEGFVNSGSNTNVVFNGTFFNNFEYFPHLGYSRQFEITDPNDRRKHGLPEAERMPPLSDDPADRGDTYLSSESDWIGFETVVSTSADQIAIAPGYLERDWEEDGRRYFHYKMDAPIRGFFSYLSADFTVLRDQWNDVQIEIFYHRPHDYNLDRMVESIKKSLAYYTENFGPYQFRQMRIIEFPRYARFAQAFPNTVPYSEGLGFIAKIDSEEDIDYVFYVTAHEVAHQWWGHQVVGADMQGSTIMVETMAQYSALMVMEQEYGREQMQRFLRYELDSYLQGRSTERLEELPLMLSENQGYIHYRKGSLVMYALRDYIGEERLNAALARYVRDQGFQDPPYTNSREFVSYLREAVPDSQQYLITDLFEEITLYDNRATDATVTERGDGTYLVHLTIEPAKYRADGDGVETSVQMDDFVDIGVYGARPPDGTSEPFLYLEKHRISDSTTTVEITVTDRPTRAGIDPRNILIDRNPEDNVTRVTEGA